MYVHMYVCISLTAGADRASVIRSFPKDIDLSWLNECGGELLGDADARLSGHNMDVMGAHDACVCMYVCVYVCVCVYIHMYVWYV
jgi:hypothetical protein